MKTRLRQGFLSTLHSPVKCGKPQFFKDFPPKITAYPSVFHPQAATSLFSIFEGQKTICGI